MENVETKDLKSRINKYIILYNLRAVSDLEGLIENIEINPGDVKYTGSKLYWFLMNKYYNIALKIASTEPKMSLTSVSDKMKQLLRKDLEELYHLDKNKRLVKTNSRINDIIDPIIKDVLEPWYEKYGTTKSTKSDPKGVERIEKIKTSYDDYVKSNPNSVLASGYAEVLSDSTGVVAISFNSPNTKEIMRVHLVNRRKVHYVNLGKGHIMLDGSVSTTTLKEVKYRVHLIVSKTTNKEYYKQVAKFLETVL